MYNVFVIVFLTPHILFRNSRNPVPVVFNQRILKIDINGIFTTRLILDFTSSSAICNSAVEYILFILQIMNNVMSLLTFNGIFKWSDTYRERAN